MDYANNLEELEKKGLVKPKKPDLEAKFSKAINSFLGQAVEGGRHRKNLNAFISLSSDGTVKESHTVTGACYARITQHIKDGHDVVGLFLNGEPLGGRNWYGQGLTKQEYITWLDYLANDSAYSGCFISKDAERMFSEKMAYFHTDLPSNLVVGAMTQVRQAWEYTNIAKDFCFFREMLPEATQDFCMYLGHVFDVNVEGKKISLNPQGSGHIPLDPSVLGLGEIQNLVNKRVINANGLLSERHSYMGVNNLFGRCRTGEAFYPKLKEILKRGRVKEDGERLFSKNRRFLFSPGGLGDSFELLRSLSLINRVYNEQIV